METLNQFKTNKFQLALILGVALHASHLFSYQQKAALPVIANTYQKAQVKELLGAKQAHKFTKHESDSSYILTFVEKHLPKKYKKDARGIAETLIHEARRNRLDPMFLMAVIMTESSFNPDVKGLHGEIGLMQILPPTAKWLAEKHDVSGRINLMDYKTNIRLGALYFSSLRTRFDKVGNRYIAAYNMGPLNVKRLVSSNIEPKIYSDKVLSNYKNIYKQFQQKNASKASQKLASL